MKNINLMSKQNLHLQEDFPQVFLKIEIDFI